MSSPSLISVCASALALLPCGVTLAAEAPEPKRNQPKTAPSRPAESDEKRAEPDYDGRDEPTTTGDVLIWIPRVLLAPPYFVSEYLLRRPIGFLIASSEQTGVPAFIYDFFTFGPDHQAGIVPVVFYQFGFRPNVGLYTFWDDAFFE